MFDSKIIIYVKFWVRKRWWKIWGAIFGPLFPQSCALILDFGCPEPPRLGPHISARRTFFQKSSLTFVVLRWTIKSPGRNDASSQTRRCPNQKTKKSAVFEQLSLFFSKIVGAPPFLRWGVVSLQEPHRSTQNYNRKWAFLKKRPTGRDMGAFLRAFSGKINKNGPFLGDGFTK